MKVALLGLRDYVATYCAMQAFTRGREASTEDVLLRLRQLQSGYSYFVGFGISYSFGSKVNNIVNPRYGGGGGGGMMMMFY